MQTITRNTLKLAAALLVILSLLGAGFSTPVAYAASCSPTTTRDLYASTGTATLYGTTSTTIWGYAANSGDPASLPGPVLDVNEGDCVQVNLHNVDIPEATSLLFQGQEMIPDTSGVAAGSSTSYVFSASSAGTFLYEAGLIPNAQHQVAMGLYGALIVRPLTAGQAYDDPTTAYGHEEVMVLSEVDPVLNGSGSPAAYDMRNYRPQYFLINGKAYPGTVALAGDPGEIVLMRYVNAGLQAHAMSTLGLAQTIIAQDGEAYAHSHNVVAETIATGQTLDTLITVPGSALQGDQFAVYDANMLLHNGNTAGFGGMMTFLVVGAGAPPPPPDAGPTVSLLSLSPNPTNGSVNVTVSATVTDGGTSPSNIQAAEFYIDGTASSPNAMMASDGTFDSTSEAVQGTITIATLGSLSSGNHVIYVRGQDANGNWGTFLSVILNLDKTGPATSGLSLTPNPSDGSVPVALTATGNDTASGGSNVTAAEYWVDSGAHTAMTIVAGAAAPIRNFTATISPPLSIGSHVVSVRSQDAFGNWGAVATITLQVADPQPPTTSNVVAAPNPTNGLVGFNTSVPAIRVTADFSDVATGGSNIVAAEGFIDAVGSTGSGFVFIATDGGFNSPTESGYGDIPLASVRALSNGPHTIYVHAKDSSGNWGDPMAVGASTILTVDKSGPTFGPITVTPPNTTRGGGSVNVIVAGSITSLSDLNFSSGKYTITDSKSSTVVNGTYTINAGGSFSFTVPISRSNSGPNSVANRRYYTFTITAADNLGNIGTATVQFYVQ
jgi:FtsP/CotA-like multicopper oxidase with cupredoxin domain